MKKLLTIKTIQFDDVDDVRFDIEFYHLSCMCSLEFYGYADTFKNFAKRLIDFPTDIKDTITFQIGEDNRKHAYYLLVKVFCLQDNAKPIFKITMDNFGDIVTGYRCDFALSAEVAEINRLGQSLLNWTPTKDGDTFVWPD